MAITKRTRADENKVVSKSSSKASAPGAVAKAKESSKESAKSAGVKESATRTAAAAKRAAVELALSEATAAKSSKKLSKKELMARRNEYAAKFFPYIEKVARRLARRLPAHVEIDDLISSGVIGLMEAADRFDPSRVDRFEAFAEFRIRGAMLDDLRSRDTLSRDMRRLSNELRDATRRLEAQLGRTPDQEEIAKRLGVGVEELYARQQKLSGSSVVGIDDAGPDLLERTGDQSAADPFEQASRRELTERMVSGIGHLPEKMQQVLSLYYCDNLNLKEIGAVLGVTESRVCQIHGEATRRLRDSLSDLASEAAA
jgi:RNA polymerase sigma factor for flagellar operon FliA